MKHQYPQRKGFDFIIKFIPPLPSNCYEPGRGRRSQGQQPYN